MKKVVWVTGIFILMAGVLLVGCASQEEPRTPTESSIPQPEPLPDELLAASGIATDVTEESVTIHTAEGETSTFQINENTTLTLEGEECSIDQILEMEANGVPFVCNIVYDDEGRALSVDVVPTSRPASISGTISSVNAEQSTITIQTPEGEKVYDIDPHTGLVLGGEACSLDFVEQVMAEGFEHMLACTIIYTEDEEGKAVYVDIESPPGLIQGTGTLMSADPATSTVTIMTDTGERTFTVDAETGAFLYGEVCSLEDLEEAVAVGDYLPDCEVLYYTNSSGDLLYLDVSR